MPARYSNQRAYADFREANKGADGLLAKLGVTQYPEADGELAGRRFLVCGELNILAWT
jgi:hypothetical protein